MNRLASFVTVMLFGLGAVAQDPNFHIFICLGQSNMEGNATTIPASYKTNVSTRFRVMEAVTCSNLGRTKGSWYTAAPPLCRCYTGLTPVDNFGRTMVANLPSDIKVGVINVAIGGTKIEIFDKATYASYIASAAGWLQNTAKEYDSNPYARIVEMAKLAQKDGVIKGILLHQGESNTGDKEWPNKVKKIYNDLMTDLGLDPTKVPLLAGEVVHKDQGGVCAGMNDIIADLPNKLPNSYVVSSSGCKDTSDNLHFNIAGYWELGRRYAMKMLSLMGPTVSITLPLATETFSAPATITISATASSSTGTVAKMEFFNGTTKIGEAAAAPYSFTMTNVAEGTLSICAKATFSDGKSEQSCVSLKVKPAQAAYGGAPWPIPGKIELENFDVGGNGVAYNDGSTGSATAVVFRNDEDVDIEDCTDIGAGYNIGYATAGEWLEYTVNVAKAGTYKLTLRAAAEGDGRTISVSANDEEAAKDIAVPNTGGWQDWVDVEVNDIVLDVGVQVVRVTVGAVDYVNLNYMVFSLVTKPLPAVALKTGWNLVGCPLEGTTDLATGMASIWDNVATVKDLTSFYDKSQPQAFNSLTKMTWGMGYAVKVTKDCVLQWDK